MSKRLEQLRNFLEKSPNDPFLLFAIAQELQKQDAWEEALGQYQALRQEHADYVGTYYHLGKCLEHLQRPEEAVEAYEAGMEVAKAAKDQHALSELAGARLALVDED